MTPFQAEVDGLLRACPPFCPYENGSHPPHEETHQGDPLHESVGDNGCSGEETDQREACVKTGVIGDDEVRTVLLNMLQALDPRLLSDQFKKACHKAGLELWQLRGYKDGDEHPDWQEGPYERMCEDIHRKGVNTDSKVSQ